MIRMSMLRNRGVFQRGKQIGLLHSVCLDTAQKTVHSLVVAGGLKGKRIVYSDQILSMSGGDIHVGDTIRYKKSLEPPKSGFFRDESGLLIGRITDYLIDEETLSLIAIQMIQGYLTREERKCIWVFIWNQSLNVDLTIPWAWRPIEVCEEA